MAAYCERMTGGAGICLKDGRPVVLRAAGHHDGAAIVRLLNEVSPAAFRSRFQCERAAPSQVARLARTGSPPGTACLLAAGAAEPDRVVGEARYVPIGGGAAELALIILDDYQGAGLGRRLLAALAAAAAGAGIERLRAVVRLDNAAMLGLITGSEWILAEATDECLMASVEISATGDMPGWPRDSARPRVLLERRGWIDDRRTAELRAAGHNIRQCPGPDQQAGRRCALLVSGDCPLAAEADQIISALPGDDPGCAAVAAAHRRRWPGKLAD